MPDDPGFKGCDSATVFAEVSSSAESEETQSLWQRLLQEMEKQRVDGAISYLATEFQQLGERLNRELIRLETEL